MTNVNLFGFAGVTNSALDVLFIVLFVLFSAAVILLSVFLLTKYIYVSKESVALIENGGTASQDSSVQENIKDTDIRSDSANDKTQASGDKNKKALSFLLLLFFVIAAGVIVRLIFTFTIKGYREELLIFTNLFSVLSGGGLNTYYTSNSIGLYPIVTYVYSIIGAIANGASLNIDSLGMGILLKLPLIIADILSAVILYRAASRYINKIVGLVLAGLVALFPPFIFASSVWGSVFSLAMPLVLATFYSLAKKNFIGTIGMYSLLLLTVKDAVFFFPVIAIFIIYNYVILIKNLKASNVKGFNEIIKSKEYRNVILLPVYVVLSVVLMYLFTLSLMIKVSANPFKFIYLLFLKPVGVLTSFGHNALNIFNLFGRNGVEINSSFPMVVFTILFAVLITGLAALIYFSRKNRANLAFLGAFSVLTLSIFFMDFSELNLIYVLGLLLLSFIFIRDKRILQIFGALSIAVLFNASSVMANAGYLNNLSQDALNVSTYTGSVLLNEGGAMAISIISSVIAILCFVYATLVLLDLAMSNKRKLFLNIENPRFFSTIKYWFKSK